MLDLLIQNGYVVDGRNNPWTKLDIGIKDGKIVKMGRTIKEQARKTIDATHKVVCPGFIDMHVHSDLLCTKPEIHQIKLKQGVTTELFGQDGISVAPVNDHTKSLWRKQIKGLNGDIGTWPWETIEEYLEYLNQSNILGNAVYLVPHGNIRTLVMGFERREATEQEIVLMKKHIEEGMEQGAVGFSTGLVYPPNVYSTTNELIKLCKSVAKYDGCFVVHMRNESFNVLNAVDEVIKVARESGVRLHISHLKVMGERNRHIYPMLLERIELARRNGVEVTFDQYPYTAGSTVFHAILPPWVHDGGTEKMLKRLTKPNLREKIKRDFLENKTFENFVYSCGWENIIISSVETDKNKQYEGMSVQEIAHLKSMTPADTALDLLIEEKANVTMIDHWGQEEDMISAMKSPYYTVGSDSIFGSKPHPRLSGTQPRILSEYVRNKKVFTLEEAIHRMTSAPAQILRLEKRGILEESFWADIVIFDPEHIKDQSTYLEPMKKPTGIEYVIVNGSVTIESGNCNLKGCGKVLKSKA